MTFDLKTRIDTSPLFNLSQDNLMNSPFFLLIHQLIPTELSSLLYNYIGRKRARDHAFLEIITPLMKEINDTIWRDHAKATKEWELSLGITKIKKKTYHQRFGKNNKRRRSLKSREDTVRSHLATI